MMQSTSDNNVSEQIINYFANGLNWNKISTKYDLSTDFMIKHKNKLNWELISQYQDLNDEDYSEFADLLNWSHICSRSNLSPNIIEKYSNYIDWSKLCKYQELPVHIIRKFENDVDWNEISKTCPSEEILREFASKIIWDHIDPYDYAFPYDIMEEFRKYFTSNILLS